jgi:hypothetical protein
MTALSLIRHPELDSGSFNVIAPYPGDSSFCWNDGAFAGMTVLSLIRHPELDSGSFNVTTMPRRFQLSLE